VLLHENGSISSLNSVIPVCNKKPIPFAILSGYAVVTYFVRESMAIPLLYDACMSSGMRSRHFFILSIWPQVQDGQARHWIGCLELTNGQRTYFRTMAQLNGMLAEYGWQELDNLTPSSDSKGMMNDES